MLHPNVAAISKVKLFFFIVYNFKINDVTKVINSCKNAYITVRFFAACGTLISGECWIAADSS